MSTSKNHILEKVLALFLTKTYKEVTLKQIIEATGMSKGGFYHHFKSKEEVFREAVTSFLLGAEINFEGLPKESFFDFYSSFLTMVKQRMKLMRRSKNISDVNYFLLLFDATKMFPELKREIGKQQNIERKQWVEIIKQAQKKGELNKNLAPENIADQFLLSFDGQYIRQMISSSTQTFATDLEKTWHCIYQQIKTSK